MVLIAPVLGHCLLFTLDRFNLVEFVLHVNIKQVEICVYSTFVTNDFLEISRGILLIIPYQLTKFQSFKPLAEILLLVPH